MAVRVEVFCMTEKKKVGDLVLEPGRRRITKTVMARCFVPVDDSYMLKASELRDGQFAKCPHCTGMLQLKPTVPAGRQVDPKEKEAAIQRAISIASQREHGMHKHIHSPGDELVPLQFGATTIEVE